MLETQLSRRAFLKGCLMTAALAALPVALIESAPLEVYGRSPAMSVLPGMIDLQARQLAFLSQVGECFDKKVYSQFVLLNEPVHGVSRAYEPC